MKAYTAGVLTHLFVDGQEDTIEQVYPADYSYSPERKEIKYTEYDEDGNASDVCVSVSADGAVIERSGGFLLDLCSRRGEFMYRTMIGEIPISYERRAVQPALSENGGELLLSYTLDIGGVPSENEIRITVRKNK